MNSRMAHLIAHLTVLIGTAGILAACGGGSTDTPTSSSSGEHAGLAQAASVPSSIDWRLQISLENTASRNAIVITDLSDTTVAAAHIKLEALPAFLANHKWTKNPSSAGNLRVQFNPGTYEMQGTGWLWEPSASGRNLLNSIIVEPTPGLIGDVILVGSKMVTGTKASTDTKYMVPGVSVDVAFDQLWTQEDGRAIRARTPNRFDAFFVDVGGYTANGTTNLKGGFRAYPSDFQQLSAIKNQADGANAEIVWMSQFVTSRFSMVNLNASTNQVQFDRNVTMAQIDVSHGDRYFVENVESALDTFNEWYFKRTNSGTPMIGTLEYIPPTSTATATTTHFEVPQLTTLLKMRPDSTNAFVSYVQFNNIKFRYTYSDPNHGRDAQQGSLWISSAIELNQAKNIKFDHCEISHVGGNAIFMNDSVQNVTVSNSVIADAGASGIVIGSDAPVGNALTTTSYNSVLSNRIMYVGVKNPSSNGIFVGKSSYNVIDKNDIRFTGHSGISVGYTWNFTGDGLPASDAHHNTITSNYLSSIGRHALSDLGAIYLLGRAPGTVVKGNVIGNVESYDGGTGQGIYLDQGSSDVIVQGNLVQTPYGSSYRQNDGLNNTVKNNVFSGLYLTFYQRINESGSNGAAFKMTDNAFFPAAANLVSGTGNVVANNHWTDPTPPIMLSTSTSSPSNMVSLQSTTSTINVAGQAALCGCALDSTLSISSSTGAVTDHGAPWSYGSGVVLAVPLPQTAIPGLVLWRTDYWWAGDPAWAP